MPPASRPREPDARPRPVRAGAPGIAPHDGRERLAEEERAAHDRAAQGATDLAVGMIRATGELARTGIHAWAEFLRRASGRR